MEMEIKMKVWMTMMTMVTLLLLSQSHPSALGLRRRCSRNPECWWWRHAGLVADARAALIMAQTRRVCSMRFVVGRRRSSWVCS